MRISGLVLIIAFTGILTAAPAAADANSITINPSTIIESLNSGTAKTYTFSVTTGFALTVEVDGLGEGTDGAPYAVPSGRHLRFFLPVLGQHR